MNMKIAFAFLAILALSFVSASEEIISGAPSNEPAQTAPTNPSSQSSSSIPVAPVGPIVVIVSGSPETPAQTPPLEVVVVSGGVNPVQTPPIEVTGISVSSIGTSSVNPFIVTSGSAPAAPIEPPVNPEISEDEDEVIEEEEGSRRRSTLPIIDLSTSANSEESATSNNPIARITGAVVGAIGSTNTIVIGAVIAALGVAGLLVYNRQRLGFVKAK